MSESPIGLRDSTGIERFRGFQLPGVTFRPVRVPIAFNTPNLAVQSFPQVSAVQATHTFVIAGNHRTLFPPGSALTSTSTLNSGSYTVVSSAFGGGNTSIVVVEAVADEGADGDVINAVNGATGSGIDVYVPTAGDLLLPAMSYLSVPVTAWDGAGTPTAYLYQQGASDYTLAFTWSTSIDLTALDVDATSDGSGELFQPQRFGNYQVPPQILPGTTPLRVVVDDAGGGAPGSSQGEGEIVIFIVPAP